MPNLVEFSLGPLRVVVRKECVLFRPRGHSRHLTAYYEPRTIGGVQVFTPHVTTSDRRVVGKHRRREFPITLARLVRVGQALQETLFREWVASSTKAELASMEKEGWTVFVADEALLLKWISRCRVGERLYRFPNDREWQELGRDMWHRRIKPTELLRRPPPISPVTAIKERKSSAESTILSFYPTEWPGGPAGWYRTPTDWMPADKLTNVFFEACGPEFRRGLSSVLRMLGVGDPDRLRRFDVAAGQ